LIDAAACHGTATNENRTAITAMVSGHGGPTVPNEIDVQVGTPLDLAKPSPEFARCSGHEINFVVIAGFEKPPFPFNFRGFAKGFISFVLYAWGQLYR